MVTWNQNTLNLIWVPTDKIFFLSKINFKWQIYIYNWLDKEGFLTGIRNMCNFSSILVTGCIIYLVENEWEKGTGVLLQLGY